MSYFLYHSIGQYPGKADDMAAAFSRFSQVWAAPDDAQWPTVLQERQTFLDLWRALIDAPPGSLTSAENVTTALMSIVGGLPEGLLRGKRVLITQDCFPSLHFLLNGLASRLGFTLHTVPLRSGETWVRDTDIMEAWGRDVGLALLTFVTSTASYRADLSALISHGRAQGSLIGLDLTQGIGISPFSLAQHKVDFCISTTLKWLCGTPGAGVVQMRPDLIADMRPELRGWFSQENPFSWDLDDFRFAPDARRFDHGTPSVLACVGSIPALQWHRQQDNLADHNANLTRQIIEHADAMGLPLASPRDANQRGGSVMLRLPGTIAPATLVDQLRQRHIHLDCRGHTLRLSPGAITVSQDVDTLFDSLQDLLRAR